MWFIIYYSWLIYYMYVVYTCGLYTVCGITIHHICGLLSVANVVYYRYADAFVVAHAVYTTVTHVMLWQVTMQMQLHGLGVGTLIARCVRAGACVYGVWCV